MFLFPKFVGRQDTSEFDVIIGATVVAPWATVWGSCRLVTGLVASRCVPGPVIASQLILI